MLETRDGRIIEVRQASDDAVTVRIRFPLSARFTTVLQSRPESVVFSARSRVARLGIDVRPSSPPQLEQAQGAAMLEAVIRPWVFLEEVWPLARELILPGLAVGRLLYCPEERRLSASEIFDGYQRNQFKLPAGFSITNDGRVVIPPHLQIYEFARKLSAQDIWTVLTAAEGRTLLNRLQMPRPVQNLVLAPGEGLITSCTAFLFKHFAMLDSRPSPMGGHLEAVALDPVQTASTRTFLELFNSTDNVVVNPSVYASLYHADAGDDIPPARRPPPPRADNSASLYQPGDYQALCEVFTYPANGERTYEARHAAVVSDPLPKEMPEWVTPRAVGSLQPGRLAVRAPSTIQEHATALLGERQGVHLLRYFPNLTEHADLLDRMRRGLVRALVFDNASYEHSFYLSARDHARLADYVDLGVDVYWLNRDLGHLVKYVVRGTRGYFCEIDEIDRFMTSIVVAVYGSSRALGEREESRLRQLLIELQDFFGGRLAVITGGGPGAMRAAATVGRELDMLVGASYLEIEDQRHNRLAQFYQVFQESSRHIRQRWFDIASFNIFLVGGVGTLEEVGLTLTDMKLGLADATPLIFLGENEDGDAYWQHLRGQLAQMVEADRAPASLLDNSLVTADAEQVIPFYRRVLRIG
ncbi:MAG: LOG family protein [Pseudomonadota bacterium]